MSDDKPQGELPKDELTALDASAMRLHEVYQSLLRAGFNRRQAEAYVAELVGDEFNGPAEVS